MFRRSKRNSNQSIEHLQNTANYNSVIALNKDPLAWNISQLKQVLKALKTKDDTATPAKKD
jgi:chaperonin cofactor prefoldin